MKGYRTVLVNLLQGGILTVFLTMDWQAAGLSEQHATWILGALGVGNVIANVWLRAITTTPIGRKD